MSNLTIDADRLWRDLMHTAGFGATTDGGIARLTLSDDDRRVRDWLAQECAALGMSMQIDEVGNMFATRPGARSDLPAIAMGSHLDTQPTGGKFDGVLGVLAALEVVRTLDAAGYRTEAPLMVINWTNEEGARFAPAMLGSAIWAGVHTRAFGDALTDAAGDSFGASLDRIGYRGAHKAGAIRPGAFFELHIEQGPILEAEGVGIGVVEGIQGMRWFDLVLTGTAAHTGSTPMGMRRNALLGMARVIEGIDRIALDHPGAVASIGRLDISPNSHNVIAGSVRATIDLRHATDAVIDRMQDAMMALIDEVARTTGLGHRIAPISRVAPVHFDPDCIASVRAGAQAAGQRACDIISGAGHDAAHVAGVIPTTMIFVPCAGGLSHNPAESTQPQECAAGAQVLLNAVLDYDRRMGLAGGDARGETPTETRMEAGA